MKKSRIVGYALTLAATLFVGSAMGQANTSTTGYVKTGTSDAAAVDNQRSYITKGKKLGFFVNPDMSFHPNWINGQSWKLTPDFSWTWSVTKAAAASSDIKFNAAVAGASSFTGTAANPAIANDPANFVELTPTDIGVYTISVAEKAPVAFGGCTGSAKLFDLVVMDEPSIAVDADVPAPDLITAPTTGGINGRTISAVGCGDLTSWNINFTISAADFINTNIQLDEIPVTINASGVPSEGTTRNTYKYDIRNQLVKTTSTAATLNGTAPTFTGWNTAWNVKAGADFSYTTTNANRADISLKHTRDFKVFVDGVTPANSDVITLYRYTVLGVNDFVTRKSDKVANNTTLGPLYGASTVGTPKIIDIYVKRAPVTGPVYHINNNIAK